MQSGPAISPTPTASRQSAGLGIACCVGALLAFATQDTLMKRLGEQYPIIEVITVRTAMVMVLLVGLGVAVRGRHLFRSAHPGPLALRGLVAFVGFSSYYVALTVLPIADAAAVYMTAPLFVTALSVPVLGERVGLHRWSAIVLGFVAVLVMLAPGSSVFEPVALVPAFSALCYAAIPLLTRRFGLAEHPLTMATYSIMAYLACCLVFAAVVHFGLPALFPPPALDGDGLLATALAHWEPLAPADLLLIGGVALLFTVGLLGITQAYRLSPASIIAPFEYSYLLWAVLLGYLVFGHLPGMRTALGGCAVVACGCYVFYRERRRSTLP